MKKLLLFSALLSLTGSLSAATLKIDGGNIRGTEAGGIYSYKGIPFAAPPVGDLRWKPSQPIQPWDEVRDTTTFGPQCIQPSTGDGNGIFFQLLVEGQGLSWWKNMLMDIASWFFPEPRYSEDCLTINVWTPAAPMPMRNCRCWSGITAAGMSSALAASICTMAARSLVVGRWW